MSKVDLSQTDAVIFDVDGTMYPLAPVQRGMALRLMLWAMTHPVSAPATARALKQFRKGQEVLRRHPPKDGADMRAAQLAHAAEAAGVAVERAEQIVRRWMFESPLDLVRRYRRPDLMPTLQALRAREMRVAVLSDYPAAEKLKALGISESVDAAVCAYDDDVRCFKPEPRGLLRCAEILSVDPARCAYVGDRVDVDVPVARAAGMQAILIASEPASGVTTISCLNELLGANSR